MRNAFINIHTRTLSSVCRIRSKLCLFLGFLRSQIYVLENGVKVVLYVHDSYCYCHVLIFSSLYCRDKVFEQQKILYPFMVLCV